MPELPEVETTCRGIEPHMQGRTITAVLVRQPKLRWPVPDEIQRLIGQTVNSVTRRAKYVMVNTDLGTVLLHLGMMH